MWTERRLLFAAALVAAMLVASASASATTGIRAVPLGLPSTQAAFLAAITTQAAAAARVDDLGGALQQATTRRAPAVAAAGDVAALEFARDPAVTQREQDAAVAHFRRAGRGDTSGIERRIRSGALLREFDGLLRKHGYSPTNLGDVLAAYLVLSWEVVNDRDATRSPKGMRAVRRQLAGPLAGVPSIAGMDDAAKQAQAERTAYLALVAVAAHQSLKSGGNPAQLASLRSNLRQALLRSGVDLAKLELTDGGLVAR